MPDDESPVPYQIPQTVFIGDKGRLVYPLDAYFFNQGDQIIPLEAIDSSQGDLYKDVVIHRVELSRGRLIVDFQCWRTGAVRLPPVQMQGRLIEGMEVRVASLLEGKDALTVLSPAMPPMSAPGTLWIISGTVASLLAISSLFLIFALRGGNLFAVWRANSRKRRAIRKSRKAIKKIKTQMAKGRDASGKELPGHLTTSAAIAELSSEFRQFLENYCGLQCRSLVPAEFLKLEFPAGLPSGEDSPRYFSDFFTRCDTMRFSGANISRTAVDNIISEIESYIKAASLKNT